jgi:hypothetical protein
VSRPGQDDLLLLQAIGEVILAAARLEYAVARLAWLLCDRDVRQSLESVGKLNESLAELERVQDGRLRNLVARARHMLAQRHQLVHSIAQWEWTDGSDPVPVWWHPKTDSDLTVDVGRVRELAHELRRTFWLFAQEVHAVEGPPDRHG